MEGQFFLILVRASLTWRLTSAEKARPAIFIISVRRMVPMMPPSPSTSLEFIMLIMLLCAKVSSTSLMTAAVSLLASRSVTLYLMG